jgi:hypothetical protein
VKYGPFEAQEWLEAGPVESRVERGGPGSGHFGHEGRPGEVGGSAPGAGEGAKSQRTLTAQNISEAFRETMKDDPPETWPGRGSITILMAPDGRTYATGGMMSHLNIVSKVLRQMEETGSLQYARYETPMDAEALYTRMREVGVSRLVYVDRDPSGNGRLLIMFDKDYISPGQKRAIGDIFAVVPEDGFDTTWVGTSKVDPQKDMVSGNDRRELMRYLRITERGGPGSGHFGHEGRPGEVGGSAPGAGAGITQEWNEGYLYNFRRAVADAFSPHESPFVPGRRSMNGWLVSPDGRVFETGFGNHDAAFADAIRKAGLDEEPIEGLEEAFEDAEGEARNLPDVFLDTVIQVMYDSGFIAVDEDAREGPVNVILAFKGRPPKTAAQRRAIRDMVLSGDIAPEFEFMTPSGQLIGGDSLRAFEKAVGITMRGGPGSGHFGHEGRPGEVGGSQPSGGNGSAPGSPQPERDREAAAILVGSATGKAIRESLERHYPVRDEPTSGFITPTGKFVDLTTEGERLRSTIHRRAMYIALSDSGPVPETAVTSMSESSEAGFGGPILTEAAFAEASANSRMIAYSTASDGDNFVVRLAAQPTRQQWGAIEDMFYRAQGYWMMVLSPETGEVAWQVESYPGAGSEPDAEDIGRFREAVARLVVRGGPGSGHFGHEGRPGEVGGSQPGDGGRTAEAKPRYGPPEERRIGGNRYIFGNPETAAAVQEMVGRAERNLNLRLRGLRLTDDPVALNDFVREEFIDFKPTPPEKYDEVRAEVAEVWQNVWGLAAYNRADNRAMLWLNPDFGEKVRGHVPGKFPGFDEWLEASRTIGSDVYNDMLGHEVGHLVDYALQLDDVFTDSLAKGEYRYLVSLAAIAPYKESRRDDEYRADLISSFLNGRDDFLRFSHGSDLLGTGILPMAEMNENNRRDRSAMLETIRARAERRQGEVEFKATRRTHYVRVPYNGPVEEIISVDDPSDYPEEWIIRGGPGSGHFGHEGRPGEVGGSQPGDGGGRQSGLRSAAELLQTPRTARWQPIRDAANAINRVHGLPTDLPAVKVVEIKFGAQRLGRLIVEIDRRTGEMRVRNLGIQLPRQGEEKVGVSEHAALTTAHEFGHYLDWTVFRTAMPPSGDWGDAVGRPMQGSRGLWYQGLGDGSLRDVLAAIKASDAYSQLQDFKSASLPWPGDDSGTKVVYDFQTVRYLREPEELFARGYSQWVAERSGNADMLSGIESYRQAARAGHAPQAWEPEDFEPIGNAFDKLFESKGWR